MSRAVITGMGLICGNGRTPKEFAEACFAGRSGLKQCTVFPTEALSTPYFGEIDGLPAEDLPNTDRLRLFFRHCADGLLKDAAVTKEELTALGRRCRTFWGTLIFNNNWLFKHLQLKRSGGVSDSFIASANGYTTFLSELTGARGQAMVVSSACASGTTAVGMALREIRAGRCEAAIAGGADALSLITACGFNALKALSHEKCNPFSVNRDGINIGEAGALFLIESLERAEARGAKIYAELSGSAINNDAYHITSLNPEGDGAANIMTDALQDAGITAKDIDYINAHGTGTLTNDAAEIKAIARVFGNCGRDVWVSTTKALIGHCMGASGAIELAAVLLAMQAGKYLPMPRLTDDEILERTANIRFAAESLPLDIKYALSTSFAFSGNNAAVVLKKFEGGGRE